MEGLGSWFQTQNFPQLVVCNKQEYIAKGCVLWAVVAVQGRVVFRGVSRVCVCVSRGMYAHWCKPPPPLWTELQTCVKTLPFRNFVSDSNKVSSFLVIQWINSTIKAYLRQASTLQQLCSDAIVLIENNRVTPE